MKLSNNPRRLVIYFFYDKRGIVDRYVPYFLKDLKENAEEIMIVSNGEIEPDGRKQLEQYGKIFVRENKGFDVWAYKEALEQYGWERLEQYDEVIMMNSTIMGPVFPLKETFDKMDTKDVDFWGLTEYYEQNVDPSGCCMYGYIPDHIQSHFIACRRSLVQSEEFHKYWDEMQMIHTYWEAVGKHEMIFTKYFRDLGFKSAVSVETEQLRSYSGYPLMMCPTKLMKEQRCPIFKRRMFFHDPKDFMSQTAGEAVEELYHYLEIQTEYDVDFIWETILRNYNQADIVKNMNLHYILSECDADIQKTQTALTNHKTALIMHLYFEDLLQESLHYAEAMPETADIYITTDSEEKRAAIETVFAALKCNRLEVRVIENRGRDVSSLLIGVRDVIIDYDLVCFVHDKKTAQVVPGTAGASFAYKCFENTLASRAYVENIMITFDQNPRLGLLTPPEPNHGPFFTTLGREWRGNYEQVKELAQELEIRVPIEEEKPPVAPYGTMFWFRPKAMLPLFQKEWKYEDFPQEPNETDNTILHAIERIYPFAVQESGYYPGIVMTQGFAGIEYGNLKYYVREYNEIMMQHHIEHFHQYMCAELQDRLDAYDDRDSLKGVLKRRMKNRVRAILPNAFE